jgi:hypothetical protein
MSVGASVFIFLKTLDEKRYKKRQQQQQQRHFALAHENE